MAWITEEQRTRLMLNLPICAASKCTSGSLRRFAAAVGFRSCPPLRHVRRQQNILPSATRVCKLFVFVSAWVFSATLCVSFVFFTCTFSHFCSQTAVLLCNPGHVLTSTLSVCNFFPTDAATRHRRYKVLKQRILLIRCFCDFATPGLQELHERASGSLC